MDLCQVMPRRRYPPLLFRGKSRQWRRVRIAFHSVVIPLMSSQISSEVEETGAGVALNACRFILNIQFKQTIFICIVDSISRRDMVPTLPIKFTTVNIVELLTRTLACIYSITEFAKQYFITSLWLLEYMPGALYKILSDAMLSIRKKR